MSSTPWFRWAVEATTAEQRAIRIATDFLDRIGDRTPVVVAVGPASGDVPALARARVVADRVLRVLRTRNGKLRVARLADVHVETLMLDCATSWPPEATSPPGRWLGCWPTTRSTPRILVETLRAWLDEFGDVIAAAARVYVHPNTLRYRLRRAAEVGGVDLGDAEARFAVMVQLRTILSG